MSTMGLEQAVTPESKSPWAIKDPGGRRGREEKVSKAHKKQLEEL